MTTCTIDGCTNPHSARGLCSTHYNQQHQPGRHARTITCETCGAEHQTTRTDGRFCSLLCRDIHRNDGQPTLCRLPRNHPVMLLLHPPKPVRPAPVMLQMACEWCGTQFTTMKATHRMCSRACKIRAKRVRRRGRERGWSSHYTWAEVMHLFIKLDKCCAYCHQGVDGQPEPDHVVPLSRGGSNSITNILPSCSLCNGDKRDLLLHEWNEDRARRNLAARTISDPRWTHLTSVGLAA